MRRKVSCVLRHGIRFIPSRVHFRCYIQICTKYFPPFHDIFWVCIYVKKVVVQYSYQQQRQYKHTHLVGISQILLLLLSSASVINVVVVVYGLVCPFIYGLCQEWEQQTGNNRIHNSRMVEVFAFPLCFTEEPSFCGLVSWEEHTRRPCTGIKFQELYCMIQNFQAPNKVVQEFISQLIKSILHLS